MEHYFAGKEVLPIPPVQQCSAEMERVFRAYSESNSLDTFSDKLADYRPKLAVGETLALLNSLYRWQGTEATLDWDVRYDLAQRLYPYLKRKPDRDRFLARFLKK